MNQCPQSGNHAPPVDADASQAAECERIVAAKGAVTRSNSILSKLAEEAGLERALCV